MNTDQKTVKRIFMAFLLYLPFQYMLVGVVGVMHSEPWPAFVLPGFKSVYSTQDYVEITEPIFFAQPADSTEHLTEVKASELFKGLPTSQLQGFIRSNFGDQVQLSSEARIWLKKQLERLYPEKKYKNLKVEWIPVVYSSEGDKVQITAKESTESLSIPFAD